MLFNLSLRPQSSGLVSNFMVSAISSVLITRLFLHLTNNFQLSFGNYHIAHVFWGGLLMLAAILLVLLSPSAIILNLISIVGGIGWGLFIDEIGKYITHDNNYWYQPAIIYIYFSFIIIYLIYRFTLTQISSPAPKINLLNSLIKKATHFQPLFIILSLFSIYYVADKILDLYQLTISQPVSHMVFLKIVSDLITSVLIILGWFFYLSRRSTTGLKYFRFAVLNNIFLGAVTKFYFEQFSAVFSLIISLLLLNYINHYKTR